MKKYIYMTFGQSHIHTINGTIFDKDTVLVTENNEKNKKDLEKYIGLKYCNIYYRKEHIDKYMHFFKKGYVKF